MAWTDADIVALERAIARGVTRVRFASGAETEFASVTEMLKALAVMRAAVATADPETAPARSFVVSSSKGL